ncbi:MAG TPA: tRNA (guanosine(46)-N7)-methyltransferase TrmB [Phycisphaerae bacterium]|nr:tRNA (guanosine(46)-N7)-methyltransferase TrmB [Phycisphaerae bacterium]
MSEPLPSLCQSAPEDAAAGPRAVPVELEALRDMTWERLFGNSRPVELEIGTGKGAFLLRRARANPLRNFLGIEWANQIYRYAVDRMQRWQVPNVRLLRTDADHFMRIVCPRDSLSALHVYHPDPWPKKRHHKRRLFKPVFVEAAARCLLPGGHWAVQTDHAGYFDVIAALLRAHPLLREVPFDDPEFGVEAARVATNYEIKYLREGRRMHQIAVKRRA